MPDEGPVSVEDPRIVLPPKDEVYNTIEGTIAHFKLIMEGLKPAQGRGLQLHRSRQRRARLLHRERRQRHPYRVRVRPPCWFNLQASREMVVGDMIADIIPTFGSVNMIGGECDR